jgi:hypothetical protein
VSDAVPESGPRARAEHFALRVELDIRGTTTNPEVKRALEAEIRRLLLGIEARGTTIERCVPSSVLHRDSDMTEALRASVEKR